jgi:hypothetical protein
MDDPDEDPSLLDQSGDPAGARLTLSFANYVPALTAQQVKALLTPMISFDVKTPVQAFTDTLPPALKEAILDHNVWVGMSLDMVMFAMGQPRIKSHEMEGQMPVDIWVYGTPPDPVTFVRINGNRVIRVEIAKVGEPLEVFTKDEVTPVLMASGNPQLATQSNVRVVGEGDVKIDSDKQAPAPPPTLREPGEKLPTGNQDTGVMRPVQMPKPHPDDTPGANPDEQQQPVAAPANSQGSQPGNTQPPQAKPQSAPTNVQQQSAPAQTPPDNAGQQPPANSSQFLSAGAAI